MAKLHIIDTLGPFAAACDQPMHNWSKVPFSNLEKGGRLLPETEKRIIENFKLYVKKIADIGYDSISMDDLAHLTNFPFYHSGLRVLLGDYHRLYKTLFSIAKKHRLNIFINTDYLFHNADITHHLRKSGISQASFSHEALATLFKRYPEVDGIILRVGENDGKDVEGAFLSKLTLKTPEQARDLLQKILPLFETSRKKLIFRTWTVGVYELGDLIWNKTTYAAVFDSIKSKALIISMKFGDTDFMRYLTLNPLFFASTHNTIVEFQTRREWEGMGTYPSFTGWEYEAYIKKLAGAKNMVGIHVWCQTGGWANKHWATHSYLDHSSFWNELNTETTLRIYKYGETADEAIASFCASRTISSSQRFIELLHETETIIKKGLYIRELAEATLYFRRTRIPPLLWIMWDTVLLTPLVILLITTVIKDKNKMIKEGDEAVRAAKRAKELGAVLALDKTTRHSLDFIYDTMVIFTRLRRYIFLKMSQEEIDTLTVDIARYTRQYPQHYRIPPLPTIKKKPAYSRLLTLFIRTRPHYRKRDSFILWTSLIQRAAVRVYVRFKKSELKDQSMGIDSLFK